MNREAITKATVVGSGAMGTLMAQVLASNHIHVALLGRDADFMSELTTVRENRRHLPGIRLSERVHPTADPARALHAAELVISAVPCQYLHSVWAPLAKRIEPGLVICSTTKGIDTTQLVRPSQILAAQAPQARIAALSGPSVAMEVARCLPTTVVVASEEPATGELVRQALNTTWFRIYLSRDVLGVELAGAMKNVIALAAGILDGLHAGDNAKSALLARGLVEMRRLGVTLGASPETFMGLAGVGDLVTTCVSPLGRNRAAGEKIGAGASMAEVVQSARHVIEGIPTSRAVLALAARHGVEMPITQAVHDVLYAGKPPLDALTELMSRPAPPAEIY